VSGFVEVGATTSSIEEIVCAGLPTFVPLLFDLQLA